MEKKKGETVEGVKVSGRSEKECMILRDGE